MFKGSLWTAAKKAIPQKCNSERAHKNNIWWNSECEDAKKDYVRNER